MRYGIIVNVGTPAEMADAAAEAEAAGWDGILCQTGELDDIRAIANRVVAERPGDLADGRYDIVVQGSLPADDPNAARAIAGSYAEAGATWWVDADWDAP